MGMNAYARSKAISRGVDAASAEDRELTKLEEALSQAREVLQKIVCNIKPEKLTITSVNDLYKLSVSLSSIAKAQVDYERWLAERRGMMEEAKAWLEAAIMKEVGARPELQDEILIIVNEATEREKRDRLLLEQGSEEPPPYPADRVPPLEEF